MKQYVAIFGGTFDPFTIAHRDICKQAMDCLLIDKFYIIPTVVDYYRKDKERWLSDGKRISVAMEMLWSLGPRYAGKWEAVEDEFRLKSLCERDANLYGEMITPRRFIHTLLDFRVHHEEVGKISLIIGSDEFANFQTWHRWETVLANIDHLVIAKRTRDDKLAMPQEIAQLIDWHCSIITLSKEYLANVSATKVRDYYRNLSMSEYLSDVRKLDSGQLDWKEVPWLNSEKEN